MGLDIDDDVPLPEDTKKYSHYGKIRRKDDQLLIRCTLVDSISRSTLICNHLVWRNRPNEAREHLLEHLALEHVSVMSDDEVFDHYINAKRIFLERAPEDDQDIPDEDEEEEEEEEEEDEDDE